jgi:hypothetical protein
MEAGKVFYNWYVRPQLLWLPDKADYKYKKLINKCMSKRGHAILSDD